MTLDLALVLGLLAAAIIMFAMNRPRMDAVALIMITALPMTGVITMNEALAGFADPNIILIAALFVIGEGLVRTGVAQRLGDWLVAKAGRSEARLITLLMIIVALVGSIMSSTGVVAIFIPVVLRIAANSGIAPGRLMMPLSMAALISGMMTLVATAPNLVIHAELVRRGHDGFHFFSFTPFGIPILILAVGYMLFARRWLVPAPKPGETPPAPPPARPRLSDWVEEYRLAGREHRLRVKPASPLVGRTIGEMDLRGGAGVNILAIERGWRFSRRLIQPRASSELGAGDILLLDLSGRAPDIDAIARDYGLERQILAGAYFSDHAQDIGMAEVMVPDPSPLIGRTVIGTRFRSRHDVTVIGLKRGREAVEGNILNTELELGDTLLVIGPWRAIRALDDAREMIVLNLPTEFDEAPPAASRAPFALLSLGVMIVLMVWGVIPNVQAALIACLLMGLFACVNLNAAYRSIHWQSLVLIVGMLPFSIALQKTGGVDLAAQGLLAATGEASPRVALAAIFITTAIFSLFISNTATAVLMAPIALTVADALGVSPYPFAMTVALAASAAFMTPVSSPVNTLVVGPGKYTFMDFIRVGTPFALVALVVSVVMTPWIFPF
ncbi:MAG: SLC13 family permease [Alphaproteobacteria bacterium HGW-Alphaproteobacteria-18]|nr:MAG: SLC13 family permease [Alphaproteobacteria bacterium HGW-Alphaproteobacteria-18]